MSEYAFLVEYHTKEERTRAANLLHSLGYTWTSGTSLKAVNYAAEIPNKLSKVGYYSIRHTGIVGHNLTKHDGVPVLSVDELNCAIKTHYVLSNTGVI